MFNYMFYSSFLTHLYFCLLYLICFTLMNNSLKKVVLSLKCCNMGLWYFQGWKFFLGRGRVYDIILNTWVCTLLSSKDQSSLISASELNFQIFKIYWLLLCCIMLRIFDRTLFLGEGGYRTYVRIPYFCTLPFSWV